MIIIKNINLYFIHISHTDNFPSTGTRLVWCLLILRRHFDKIPKQEVWSCLNGQGVREKYMNLVP